MDRPAPPSIDWDALRRYRLGRVQSVLADAEVDLAVLASPVSLQYAVDFDEYQLFQSRIPTFTLLVPASGRPAICGAYRWKSAFDVERLPPQNLSHFDAGLDMADAARKFANLIRSRIPGRARIAVERLDSSVVQALMQVGFDVVDAGGLMEKARSIKSADEVILIRNAIRVANLAIDTMRAAVQPGVTENELFAVLNQVNTAHGGRWLDGRMLASGHRTNPWLQESTDKPVAPGELIAFDTDMIGPYGYFADVSRTFLFGDKPTGAQKDVYARAFEEVHYNMDLVRPGITFKELSDRAFRQSDEFVAHRYPCLSHGAGMSDEWPYIRYRQDWDALGYHGVVEEGMVLCLESFVGSDQGGEGVKLEQQVLVTEDGVEVLSDYPFEDCLLQ
ncbi:MAG: Xaa-Pro peptidase family protein [Alphaproteobacteria bacterium]